MVTARDSVTYSLSPYSSLERVGRDLLALGPGQVPVFRLSGDSAHIVELLQDGHFIVPDELIPIAATGYNAVTECGATIGIVVGSSGGGGSSLAGRRYQCPSGRQDYDGRIVRHGESHRRRRRRKRRQAAPVRAVSSTFGRRDKVIETWRVPW